MDLTKLNAVASLEQKELKKNTELIVGQPYDINKIRTVTTRFGKRLVADLGNFETFIPPRLTEELEPFIGEINNGGYAIVSRGAININGNTSVKLEFAKTDSTRVPSSTGLKRKAEPRPSTSKKAKN